MNKQEVIEKLQGMKQLVEEGDKGSYEKGFINALTYALNVTKQLDEPEKPVVPQFVDTWVQGCKYNGFDLYEAMTAIEMPREFDKWLETNSETFAKAWLFGYTVEKEKLYKVEIPNPNEPDSGHIVLQKDKNNKVFIDWHYADDWKVLNSVKLTEAEIKKDFAWAWQFAEEVEE